MSAEVRPVIGLLSRTVRAQVLPMSVLPTHSCCHVEWAETDATVARRAKVDFMLALNWMLVTIERQLSRKERLALQRLVRWTCRYLL